MSGCTVSYLVLLVLTFELVMPLLDASFARYGNDASLIFMPHAVRILAAWLYGWRAVPLLIPSLVGEHLFLSGTDGWTLANGIATIGSVVCGPLAFDLLAAAGLDLRRGTGRKVKWPDLVLVAGVAAAIDAGLTGLAYGHDIETTSAWFLGDVIGMLVVFLLLRSFFSLRRRVRDA